MGTKLSDLVVIALGLQNGVPGLNPTRGISGNCLDVVGPPKKIFFMHKESVSQQQTRRIHTAIPSVLLIRNRVKNLTNLGTRGEIGEIGSRFGVVVVVGLQDFHLHWVGREHGS